MPGDHKRSTEHGSGVVGLSAPYVEALYTAWQEAPHSLPESWQIFFEGFDLATCPRACVASDRARAQSQVLALVEAYRTRGHLGAHLDPLSPRPALPADLALAAFGLTETELDQVFDVGGLGRGERATLREIVQALSDTYCGTVGAELLHVQDPEARGWLLGEMERTRNRPTLTKERRKAILADLVEAETFESFLQAHYPGQKRFSLEGGEVLIAALHALVVLAADLGVEEVVIGMAHRGRLNVLANILDKPYAAIFAEFEGWTDPDCPGGDGDVKYHKGYASLHDGRVGVLLASNPSHLEAVNPVVEGRVRARQWRRGDAERKRVVPLLVHGDAALAGQGLVAETLNLSQLSGYRSGGTVHLVVNNQIGFTASPTEERSSRYPTDVFKMLEAPILHVNGDDPEAVVHATALALRFRQAFARDVCVDIVCYRRHGHSEADDPSFTHPLLYREIRRHESVRAIYASRLVASGELTPDEAAAITEDMRSRLSRSLDQVKEEQGACAIDDPSPEWSSGVPGSPGADAQTGSPHELLVAVAERLCAIPEGFSLDRRLAARLPEKLSAVREGRTVDWALAESLAFGSLALEGTPVRLSGQDSVRGTFSQRHLAWLDTRTGEPYVPLQHLAPEQAPFEAWNSALSEGAVLGFEYGYSLSAPEWLVIWEAQFGDFANGAQVVIDQFVVSGEAKWQRQSGLVLLLPHGYEGQGPEHSNAYLERYLAACADDNIRVVNPTTPAQIFHALRRQVRRPVRKPLVVMAPKSLLRHPRAVSPVDDLVVGRFSEVLDDPTIPGPAERLVLCTGRLFYDLLEQRETAGRGRVAIVRLEQLYPLPLEPLARVLESHGSPRDLVWAQEEPENRGAYRFLRPHLEPLAATGSVRYVGRPAAASPATGSIRRHREEQKRLVEEAIAG